MIISDRRHDRSDTNEEGDDDDDDDGDDDDDDDDDDSILWCDDGSLFNGSICRSMIPGPKSAENPHGLLRCFPDISGAQNLFTTIEDLLKG